MRSKTHNVMHTGTKNSKPLFNIVLAHEHTPRLLVKINDQLAAALDSMSEQNADNIDKITVIINERASLVKKLLSNSPKNMQCKSDESTVGELSENIDIRAFAEAEYAINKALENIIQSFKKKVIGDIASLNNNRIAIGKYTGQNVKLHQRTSAHRRAAAEKTGSEPR